MKRIWYAFSLTVFVIGLVAFAQTRKGDVEPARSYAVVMANYRIGADGSRTNLNSRVVLANASGELRQTTYDPNNAASLSKQSPLVARTEEGLFATAPGHPERKLISSTPVPKDMSECFRSAKCLSSMPQLVRVEELACLQVYVMHNDIPAPHPMEWMEQSYSPKIGFMPLRKVMHFRDGSEWILEATSVEFKEVPDDINDDIKAMPVRKP